MSGNCQKWEEEKQAFLAHEKVSLAEAMHNLGEDFIIDLAACAVLKGSPPDVDYTIDVAPQCDDVVVAEISKAPEVVSKPQQIITIQPVTLQSDVDRHNRTGAKTSVAPMFGEDVTNGTVITDERTETVCAPDGIVGSYVTKTPRIRFTKTGCTNLCRLPRKVLDVMILNDPTLAEKCQLVQEVLGCGHLDGVQYQRHRLRDEPQQFVGEVHRVGKSSDGRHEALNPNFFDVWKIQTPAPKDRKLSNNAWLYLQTLKDPGIAARALSTALKYTRKVGRRCTLLIRAENWIEPSYDVIPVRLVPFQGG